jgi:hypothetical protein
MKRLLTAGLTAAVATVSLLPNVAIADQVAIDLDSKGRGVFYGLPPSSTVVFEIANSTKAVKTKANSCGLLKVVSDANGYYFAPPSTFNPLYPPYIYPDDVLPLPVAVVPTCTGATPSATVPATFKTATGEVWRSSLTPSGVYYTANTKLNKGIQLSAKTDACGIAKPSLVKLFLNNGYGAMSDYAGGIKIRSAAESPTELSTTQFEGGEFIDGEKTPICSKTKLYIKAPN